MLRQINTLQQSIDGFIKPEITPDFISPFLGLPGLIGFWPMATVQRSTGNVPNYAPTYTGATKQDFVYNGNPKFDYTTTGVPYIDFDGTGDFLSVADNTDIDILGTETQYANPGMSVLAWLSFDSSSNDDFAVTKYTTGGNASFYLRKNALGAGIFAISTDGTNFTLANSPNSSFVDGQWYFMAGTFFPSTSVNFFLNNVKYTNTTSVPASIFNSNAPLLISGVNAGATLLMTGNCTLVALCASALSDSIIQSLFQQTRSLFRV